MSRRSIITAVILATFLAVVCFADPYFVSVVGPWLLLLIALPFAVIGCILLLIAICSGRSRRSALELFFTVGAVGCFVGLAIPANRFVQQRAVATAKEYPARVAPFLEAYHQSHGSWPTSLEQVPSAPALPWLLRRSGYRSNGHTYSFSFRDRDARSPLGIWNYNSSTKTWDRST